MTTPSSSEGPKALSPSVNGWNAEYLDEQYARFREDPSSVSSDVRAFFLGFELASDGRKPAVGAVHVSPIDAKVDELLFAYREHGHVCARTDPFDRARARPEVLTLAYHGLTEADLSQTVSYPAEFGRTSGPLRELVALLEQRYCGTIAYEFMHIPEEREREWFRTRIESDRAIPKFTAAQKARILEHLTSAEIFDRFCGKRYQGKKRFSLEGGEGLIPLLKWATDRAGELGVAEIVAAMPHRGRLSVLRNWVGKDNHRLFTEFEDSWTDAGNQGGGDVKYHRGYSGDHSLPDGRRVIVSMMNNPSHLESVNAVAMGKCRANQDFFNDHERRKIICLIMHGDGAVAGQGVVAECLNMSRLEGYTVGGTIHVVINNLVAFTTDPEDDRSTMYCTDIGKMINTPVIHVNGHDPEAIVAAAMMAVEYRHEFGKDVFVELVCYRKYGHNEQDEPGYTQPELYRLVREHPGPAEVYRRRLIAEGSITEEAAQGQVDREMKELEQGQTAAQAQPVNPVPPPGGGEWAGYQGVYSFESPKTAVDASVIAEVCAAMGKTPEGFNVHPKLKSLLQSRAGLPSTKKLSHADAEQIAVGTLLLDGVPVRFSGQDSRRGTFTSRHAVLRDEHSGTKYTSLNHVRPGKQATYSCWDSPLSEYSVMGFDYGYSRGMPRALVAWEGQFGDFANTSQVIIDQYLAGSEVKWHRWGGLVLLLPHGYEGQGPEHSSAKLERFLTLCADDNMEVVYPSTGAQTFHMLRRQALRNFRKPLVVMTPKKYLRYESATIEELSTGQFQHLIDDPKMANPASCKGVTRVVYCSGKVYHELNDRREQSGRTDVAIVRIEQLYPFHAEMASKIDARYPEKAERVWVQEEPRNAGAYMYIADVYRVNFGLELKYIGRLASASPATGSEHAHKDQQERILSEAIAPLGVTSAKGSTKDGKSVHAAPKHGKH